MSTKAERDLPGLQEWVEKLLVVADDVLANATYTEDDHFGFMSMCFLSRQVGHARSMLVLVPRRDTVLIGRSMIEGLCQLLWAGKEPAVRPLQWRSFAWVHDWRVMNARVALGEEIASDQRTSIENALRDNGDQFLTRKGGEARRSDTPFADPYHDDWKCGRKLREICESVGGADLYRDIYGTFSDWHHWGVGSVGAALTRNGEKVIYSSTSTADSAIALACGFQCLWQTLDVTDTHLRTGRSATISELHDGYRAWHEERTNQ